MSPSGIEYTRNDHPDGASTGHGPTWDRIEVPAPEPGKWTVKMYGADVDPQGEEARLTIGRGQPENQAPVADFHVTFDGRTLSLDGRASHDPDGTIDTYRWFVDDGTHEQVLTDRTASVEVPVGHPLSVSLEVLDNRGRATFATKRLAAVDVKPGSAVNPVKVSSNGVIPLAILSADGFDATQVDPTSLRVGPAGGTARVNLTDNEDVDGDGRLDLVTHVPTQSTGLTGCVPIGCRAWLPRDGAPP